LEVAAQICLIAGCSASILAVSSNEQSEKIIIDCSRLQRTDGKPLHPYAPDHVDRRVFFLVVSENNQTRIHISVPMTGPESQPTALTPAGNFMQHVPACAVATSADTQQKVSRADISVQEKTKLTGSEIAKKRLYIALGAHFLANVPGTNLQCGMHAIAASATGINNANINIEQGALVRAVIENALAALVEVVPLGEALEFQVHPTDRNQRIRLTGLEIANSLASFKANKTEMFSTELVMLLAILMDRNVFVWGDQLNDLTHKKDVGTLDEKFLARTLANWSPNKQNYRKSAADVLAQDQANNVYIFWSSNHFYAYATPKMHFMSTAQLQSISKQSVDATREKLNACFATWKSAGIMTEQAPAAIAVAEHLQQANAAGDDIDVQFVANEAPLVDLAGTDTAIVAGNDNVLELPATDTQTDTNGAQDRPPEQLAEGRRTRSNRLQPERGTEQQTAGRPARND
jgi:hypothetical protein